MDTSILIEGQQKVGQIHQFGFGGISADIGAKSGFLITM